MIQDISKNLSGFKRHLGKALIIFKILFLGLLIWFFITGATFITNKSLTLENFKSLDNEEILLDVTDGLYKVVKYSFDVRPDKLDHYLSNTVTGESADISETNSKGQISTKIDGKYYNEPTLLIFFKDQEMSGYIEILRQSEVDLQKLYNFNKPGGYYVLGRTSLTLPQRKPEVQNNESEKKEDFSLPDFTNYYPNDTQIPIEIKESVAIMKFIWEKPLNSGPNNNQSYENYLPLEKIELLRENKWSAQCTGIRNIFKDLALASPSINKIRDVDLFQYSPPFPDLIPNGHSVIEVYSRQLSKWVMIDPYFASIFMAENQYLSVKDFNEYKNNLSKIKIQHFSQYTSIQILGGSNEGLDRYMLYFGTISYGPTISHNTY